MKKRSKSQGIRTSREDNGQSSTGGELHYGTTGRYLVTFREGATETGVKALAKSAGLSIKALGSERGITNDPAIRREGIVFPKIGVAVVAGEPDQIRALGMESSDPILSIEKERIVYAVNTVGIASRMAVSLSHKNMDYLQGYRDAVNHLVENLGAGNGKGYQELLSVDTRRGTWGLSATKVLRSSYSGRAIKVAVLDTGFNLVHPDFSGRRVVFESFVEDEEVEDGNGHGTHCIGTACGPRTPVSGPRYGVAYEAEIYAGKVLGDEGWGDDTGILAGIEWAVTNGCHIISMSLGAPTTIGDEYSKAYENAAQRALAGGTLIVAAAGNESSRPDEINPVGHPANCPSILAVAAVDREMLIAYFSNAGLVADGGQVDIAAPGVAIYSSWPLPRRYRTLDGTSMATPHVAGIAALLAEAQGARGSQLWNLLVRNSRRLNLLAQDVGAGLVQAP